MCCGRQQKDASDRYFMYSAPGEGSKHHNEWRGYKALTLCKSCADEWDKVIRQKAEENGIDIDKFPKKGTTPAIDKVITEGNNWLFTRIVVRDKDRA